MSLLGASNSVIINRNNEWIAVFPSNDPTKPSIEIKAIRIASRSDKFDPKKNYVGLIIYLCNGKSNFTLNNVECRTGDIYIKDSSLISEIKPNKKKKGPYYHGKLFQWIFGCWKTKKLNFVGGGFSYVNGKWKFNSQTYNKMNPK